MMPRRLLLSTRFGIFVIAVSLLNLAGCASPYRSKVTSGDVIGYRIDCQNAQAQIVYLESIKPNKDERAMAALELLFLGPFVKDRSYKESLVRNTNMWHIENAQEEARRCKK